MLIEYFDGLKEFTDSRIKECLEFVNSLYDNCSNLPEKVLKESLINLQQILIDVGNSLEKEYNLMDSQEIHGLEECCELIYLCVNQEEYNTDYLKRMLNDIAAKLGNVIADLLDENRITDYHTSIVLIAKNEEKYIREWIEYHLEVGISHFYIYDNESTEVFKEILEPYIERGIVTYTWYPGNYVQMKAYDDALNRFKLDTKYMAFIDGDEFIVPMKGDHIPTQIDLIMDRYSNREYRVDWNAGGIGVNWRCYGSSGNDKPVDGLITEEYIWRAEDEWDNNAHIKTICNPRSAISFETNPHACTYQRGYFCISERGSYIPGAFFYDGRGDHLVINHYYTKSKQEYIEKWHRGWPDTDYPFKDDEEIIQKFNKIDAECSKVEDRVMERFLDKVKLRLKNATD